MRFLGITLNENLVCSRALSSLYGIGIVQATLLCNQIGVSKYLKLKQLTEEQLTSLKMVIEASYVLGSDLIKVEKNNIEVLKKINCYRGFRHRVGLPVRGQRTHTNASTVRRMKRIVVT